jgi:hypothetical protein
MRNKKVLFAVQAAMIAALYVVLTYITNLLGLASGTIQVRFSEALCILPVFTPAAIPGLFIGCLISNLITEIACHIEHHSSPGTFRRIKDRHTIRNVKSISYYSWGDGMNVFASNNVLFDGVFCRNSDDCTTVYGTRLGFVGGCKNITMRNSTLWADVELINCLGHDNRQKKTLYKIGQHAKWVLNMKWSKD